MLRAPFPCIRSRPQAPISAIRWILGVLLAISIQACERPEIVDPNPGNFVAPSQTGVRLDLVDASFRVDGVLRSRRINLSTDRFAFLYVFVKSKGMFIVSTEENDAAQLAGRFSGARLTVQVGANRIELETSQGHLLGDSLDRSAWVEYIPDYDFLGPDAKPTDAVVGLAARKNLIPGFLEQE